MANRIKRIKMTKENKKSRQERASETWKQYEEGVRYQKSINLHSTINTCIDFYEGRQWGELVTQKTQGMPRPVIPFTRMIAHNKISAMNNKPCRITYEADSIDEDSANFTAFSDYQLKEMGAEAINRKAAYNGVVKGTYVFHVYWDAEAKGKRGKIAGAVREETLDPRNVIFCDPTQIDEQKQKYIIIVTREEVEAVRENLPKGIDKDLIVADDADINKPKQRKEQEGTEMCTVLIKYFRIDGEVFCEKSTKTTVIRDAFPLRPEYERIRKELFGENADVAYGDSPDTTEDARAQSSDFGTYKPSLYPIAVGQYIPREECIYGISEVEGLVANQKWYNVTLGAQMLQIHLDSMSKWVVTEDALEDQEITNQPGQTIIDHSITGNGIRRVPAGQISNGALSFLDNFLGNIRAATGVTEVMSGEVLSANMSGAAIAQLQSQAQLPNEENRKAFWRVLEKVGRILEQFYRMYYYNNTEYKYSESVNGKRVINNKIFAASNYDDVEFTVVAKVSSGTASSPAGDITVIDQLKAEGLITTRQWLEAYPADALSDKNHLIELVKQAEMDENARLKAELEQCNKQILTLDEMWKKVEKPLDAIQQTTNENTELKQDIAILYNELRKFQNSSQYLALKSKEYHDDASMFANEIANNALLAD